MEDQVRSYTESTQNNVSHTVSTIIAKYITVYKKKPWNIAGIKKKKKRVSY